MRKKAKKKKKTHTHTHFKPSPFHDVTEIGNICFMLERKSLSDSHSFEVFDNILFD